MSIHSGGEGVSLPKTRWYSQKRMIKGITIVRPAGTPEAYAKLASFFPHWDLKAAGDGKKS